jgi:peptidoglycan/LPS O-acetylase OafA/YrhL
MAKERLEHLDALRGWAILGVFFIHVGSHFPGWIANSTADGGNGVELFYTLSALTLFLTRRTGEMHPLRAFFIRRFFRIAPMFYVVVAYYALQGRIPGLRVAALLFFVNGAIPPYLNGLFGEWSVAIEVMFYACIPLLYRAIRTLDAAIWLTLGMLVAGWGLTQLAVAHPLVADPKVWADFCYFWFPNHWSAFGAGIVIYFVLQRPPDAKQANALLAVAMFLGLCVYKSYATLWIVPHHLVYTIAFVPLVVSLHLKPNRLWVNRATVYLGRISYSCYLVHNPVKDHLVNPVMALSLPPMAKFAVLLAAVIGGTVLVASLSYRFVELPGIALGKRVIARLDRRAELTARAQSA